MNVALFYLFNGREDVYMLSKFLEVVCLGAKGSDALFPLKICPASSVADCHILTSALPLCVCQVLRLKEILFHSIQFI